MPFSVERRDGVVFLTLDTPRAEVNIFNRETAEQTLALMSEVRPDHTRAVVFRTAKPTSFINGAGVVLSPTVNSHEDVMRLTEPFRLAYLAVRAAPVPTIAVVEGMCWGCGVEFLLNCRHRLAAGTHDTQFRMTELEDYVEVPVFRGTANLPPCVGLPDAIDFLLWGRRWSAREALERGLIQEIADPARLEQAVDDFVARASAGHVRPAFGGGERAWHPSWDHALAAAHRRVDDLPSAIQRPYRDSLELLEDGARRPAGEAHFEANYRAASASACSTHARQAYAFLYIRQTAATLAAPGGATKTGEVRFGTHDSLGAEATASLRELLVPRAPLAGLGVTFSGPPSGDWASFVAPDAADGRRVAVATSMVGQIAAGPALHRPLPATRFIELREPERGALRPLAAYLRRLRFEVAVSRGATTLGSTVLLARFLAPLVAALLDGERAEDVDRTLRAFEFTRRPAALLADIPVDACADAVRPVLPARVRDGDVRAALVRLLAPARWEEGEERQGLVAALTVSLLAAVEENLAGSGFDHPAAVDLAARELLDFPVRHRSLCSHLTRVRVAAALEERGAVARLVDEGARERAARFAAGTRSFYR